MMKRLVTASILAILVMATAPSAGALPDQDICQEIEDADLFVGQTGVGTRDEIGYDCVLVVYLFGLETATLQSSNEVQRFRIILTEEHPLIEDDQDVVVKNQMGCCVEVDANGYLLTIDRTGLFGGDEYLTLFVDGRKVLICPWTEEDGLQWQECELDPGP